MVDVTDVQGYSSKFQNQLELLQEADIPEADREAIDEFLVHLRANKDLNKGTLTNHLNKLRLSAERATTPLTEMDKPDADRLIVRLEDEYGLAEGTLRNYKKPLRQFFRWRGEEWYEEIVIGASPDRTHDPDEELTGDEIDAMLDAAANPRDRALVAILADTGLRLGAVLSLRVGDYEADDERAVVTINEDANVKGDAGPKPLTWSRSYVANWLSDHPRSDQDDVALIHALPGYFEADEDGALRQGYVSQRISTIARDAGLSADRVHAHLFRDTAISQWIREDMGEQAIKFRAGWSKDSRQFDTYSRVRDEEMADVVFGHYGIEGEDTTERPELDQCPSCQTSLRGGESFCPACAFALDSAAAERRDEAVDAVADQAVEAEDVEKRRAARFVADVAEEDSELARALARTLDDHL